MLHPILCTLLLLFLTPSKIISMDESNDFEIVDDRHLAPINYNNYKLPCRARDRKYKTVKTKANLDNISHIDTDKFNESDHFNDDEIVLESSNPTKITYAYFDTATGNRKTIDKVFQESVVCIFFRKQNPTIIEGRIIYTINAQGYVEMSHQPVTPK